MKKKIVIVLAILQIALLVANGVLGFENLYYPLFLSAVFYTPFFILFTMLFLHWVNKNTSRRNYVGAYLAINCIVNMAASGIPLLVFMLIEKIRHKELNWEADWCKRLANTGADHCCYLRRTAGRTPARAERRKVIIHSPRPSCVSRAAVCFVFYKLLIL